jgi:putative hydrolase of the HAD superfamily
VAKEREATLKVVVVWDFAGTLAYRDGGEWGATLLASLRRHVGEHSLTPETTRPYLQEGFPWHSPTLSHFHRTADEWWNALFPVLANCMLRVADIRPDLAWTIAHEARQSYADPAKWRVFDEVVEALTRVRQTGFTSVLLSNFTPELGELVMALGLADHFDHIIGSAEIGYEKPHPEAFHIALRRAGSPAHAWMVGDSMSCDVRGGASAGLRPIWICRGGRAPANVDDVSHATCANLLDAVRVIDPAS